MLVGGIFHAQSDCTKSIWRFFLRCIMNKLTTEQLSKIVDIDVSLLNKMKRATKLNASGKIITVYKRNDLNSHWYNASEVEKLKQEIEELQKQLEK